jgi:hypothetical protein
MARGKRRKESGTNNDVILLLLLVQIIQLSKIKDLLDTTDFIFKVLYALEMGSLGLSVIHHLS